MHRLVMQNLAISLPLLIRRQRDFLFFQKIKQDKITPYLHNDNKQLFIEKR